jgi:hypothetical protein
MEASFFVTEDALRKLTPNMKFDEDGILSAFDLNRKLIYATAARVYGRGRKGSYELQAADFCFSKSAFQPAFDSISGPSSDVTKACANCPRCPLSGVKRTSRFHGVMSAFDPKPALAGTNKRC